MLPSVNYFLSPVQVPEGCKFESGARILFLFVVFTRENERYERMGKSE